MILAVLRAEALREFDQRLAEEAHGCWIERTTLGR
jgi:hypothetical protein